jgi:hypothetical protein
MSEFCGSCGNPRNPIYKKCPFCGNLYEEEKPTPKYEAPTPVNYGVPRAKSLSSSSEALKGCCGVIFGLIIFAVISWWTICT